MLDVTPNQSRQEYEEDPLTIEQILGKPNDIFNGCELYRVDARSFLPYMMDDWELNRTMNQKHVKNLYMYADRLTGQINLVRCKYEEDKILLIDGQHRREAIKKRLEDDTKLNFDIRIEIKDVNSEDEIIEYFTQINNVLPMDTSDIPTVKYKNLIDALMIDYPEAFRYDESPRPYTSRKKFMSLLRAHGFFENYKITEADLYKEIKSLNSKYSTNPMIIQKSPKTSYEKSRKTGFYLLLDKENRWINTLKFILDNKKMDKKVRIRVKK